ncbi:PHP domain-containing protein [Brachybacterium sp. UMB0905]|uniref:PHP domain-containing protein n=1 Tax=Brachybacterium sp. UMB0905 TaxID=2069310 RepID=UPI0011AF6835|nr:PHP domain-containing protein [Brachybacterium sp. UMB0905]
MTRTPGSTAPTSPSLDRRSVLRAGSLAAGAAVLTGTSAAAAPATPAAALPSSPAPAAPVGSELTWLVLDHHVHSLYSHDAKYTMEQVLDRAEQFGVDAIAFTEHANLGHAHEGGVWEANREIRAAREGRDLLVFQGLEWYIPAAEHGTVMVAPGPNEARLLRTFELMHDGKLNGWEKPDVGSVEEAEWEQHAADAIAWLGQMKRDGFIDDVLVLANHPSRLGIDAPHELRLWQDADPEIFIGMEGAPGAQGSAFGKNRAPEYQRGEYENSPRPDSHPDYPAESYVTRGGFDWMTSVVGGVWDSLLAEGRRYWITSNSDLHLKTHDTWRVGDYPTGEGWDEGASGANFDRAGRRPVPVDTGEPQGGSDYWPGQFSRTHVGATSRSHLAVMEALRAGRVWIDHGHLLGDLAVELTTADGSAAVTLGGTLQVAAGTEVVLRVHVTPATRENSAGILPVLAHVDLIRGDVTGPFDDPDTQSTPNTRVAERQDTADRGQEPYTLEFSLGPVNSDLYVRLRGSDGNRSGVGPMGADVDPAGPIPHGGEPDAGNPWADTWFYTNPMFIEVR